MEYLFLDFIFYKISYVLITFILLDMNNYWTYLDSFWTGYEFADNIFMRLQILTHYFFYYKNQVVGGGA